LRNLFAEFACLPVFWKTHEMWCIIHHTGIFFVWNKTCMVECWSH